MPASKISDRLSQLLGGLFLLTVGSVLLTVLNCSGYWHDLGLNLTAGFVEIFVGVFVADLLVQKYNEEKFDPHREYVYSLLQQTITEVLLRMIPPLNKSLLNHADFGEYFAPYYNLVNLDDNDLDTISRSCKELCSNKEEVKKCVEEAKTRFEPLVNEINKIRQQFFTILDPDILASTLKVENQYRQLDFVVTELDQNLNLMTMLYAAIFTDLVSRVYELQNLLLSRASTRMTSSEWQASVKLKLETYKKKSSREGNP